MKRWCGPVVVVIVLGVLAGASAAAERGTARGAVIKTGAWTSEDGQMRLTVTIRSEGIWEAMFSTGPQNRAAFATVGALRRGERVTVAWVREDDRNWIREIARGGAEGEEGVRRDRERAEEGERAEKRERERDRRVEREGDGERGERELHERRLEERMEREERERDRDRREEGDRERRRDGEGVREGPRDGEGNREGPRDGEVRREGPRDEGGEHAERGDRDHPEEGAVRVGLRDRGESREGDERRDRERARQITRGVRVLTVARYEGWQILRVRVLNGDDVLTFKIGPDRKDLAAIVGTLQKGDKATAAFYRRGDAWVLREIAKTD